MNITVLCIYSLQCWCRFDGTIRGAVFRVNEENPGGQSPRYHPDDPGVLARHEGSGKGSHFGNWQHRGASRWDKRMFEDSHRASTCGISFFSRFDGNNKCLPLWSGAGLPFNEVYCASKFAIEGACESLAILLQHFNIQSVFSLIQRGKQPVREGKTANAGLVSAVCLSLSVAQSTLISWPTCRRQKSGMFVKTWTNRHSLCMRNTCSTATLSSKIQHRTLRTLWRYVVKVKSVGSGMFVYW